MKNLTVFILLILFSLTTFAQTPRNPRKPVSVVNPALEKEEFDKAVAIADAAERIAALQKFTEDYPKSKEKTRALELITGARAALADEKLRAGEKEAGIELFKLALRETPKPVSDKLFTEVLVQIPTSLFFRGAAAAAVDAAKVIEEKADGSAKQMLALATFYLGTENAAEAKRLANRAAELEPTLPAAYQTLGIANRLDFQFDESVAAYQKALELDQNSSVSKRSLAEMKRATGKPAEAVALYREITAKDANDAAAQTGLILALFEAENKTEAESEFAKSLEANPNNLFLLVGAAYWYAAHEQGARAIELAEKAVALEPRYTWARIALARGFLQQKRPFDAEKTLLAAKQYGDFPTLDYELAAARFQAGFYREAAEGLQKKFVIKDNLISTQLGGRVLHEAKSFTELLAAERRASIFQTQAADNAEIAERLKTLLDFSQKLETSTDEMTVAAADEFIKGDDKIKLHRQLFVANQLAQKRRALPKVLELTRAAVTQVDAGLDVPDAAALVLAEELYQSRRFAIARNELVIVPEVSRPTLLNIVRGRIEDLAGWALFQENKPAEAVTRLKRAVSVLPEKSSWWRSSMWRLGAAHESAGNFPDALDAYLKSYTNGEADRIKYGVIESVYVKVNGSADGLERKIGSKPAALSSNYSVPNAPPEQPKAQPTPNQKTEIASPTIVQETTVTPVVTESAPPIEETKPAPENSTVETPIKAEPAPTPEIRKEVESQESKVEEMPDDRKIATKPAIENQNSEMKSKPLFEPIVISVPKVEPVKKPATEAKSEVEKPVENGAPRIETKTNETVAEKKPAEDNESRPRVIMTADKVEALPPCKMIAGQETISILNNGGSLSVLLRLEGEVSANEIKAISSSPTDVEVTLEPEFGKQPARSFFAVKSISSNTGLFTLTFESVCGKKEIPVKVR